MLRCKKFKSKLKTRLRQVRFEIRKMEAIGYPILDLHLVGNPVSYRRPGGRSIGEKYGALYDRKEKLILLIARIENRKAPIRGAL